VGHPVIFLHYCVEGLNFLVPNENLLLPLTFSLQYRVAFYRFMKMCAERGILFGGMLQGGGFGGDGDRIRDIEGRGRWCLSLAFILRKD
jgi:hypothetical protein